MAGPTGLRDIAKICGVSVSTVSRVLNGKNDNRFSASPQVRDRIIAAAQELNYSPNSLAKSLKTRKTMQVLIYSLCVEVPFRNSINLPILHHALRVLASKGYSALAGLRLSKEEHMGVNSSLLDGALIIDLQRENPYELEELEAHSIPYVSINDLPGIHGGAILVDDLGGARMALDYLISLGHSKIAYMNPSSMRFFSSFEDAHYSASQRHEGYVRTLNERGLGLVSGHDRVLKPQEVTSLVREKGITAVLCYSAEEARILLEQAENEGIDVPGKFSIIAFNDMHTNFAYWPQVTAISLPERAMGEEASYMLLRMIQGDKGDTKVLQESLVIRKTTAIVPGK